MKCEKAQVTVELISETKMHSFTCKLSSKEAVEHVYMKQ